MRTRLIVIGLALVAGAGVVQAVHLVNAANVGVTALSGAGGGGPYAFEDGDGDDSTTINVGDTVIWTFESGALHTVTSDTGAFDSGDFQDGGTYQFTFNSAGTYPYYCEVHGQPGGAGMAGTIIVEAAATNTPQATNTSPAGATNTPTRTPTRTWTPAPTSTGSVTPVPATATPLAAAPISATEPPAGGARPIVTAPSVGTGDAASSGGKSFGAVSLALAIAGAAAIGASTVARRRS